METGADNAHLAAALTAALLEGASELNPLLQEEGGSEEVEEADAAAAAARPLAAIPPRDEDVVRRVVARWRAFVAERKGLLLLRLLEELPNLFFVEVLKRLDPTSRTMLAQVGRPWLAAVLASGLPRLPRGVTTRLRLRVFCKSAERLAWAKANGCPWGVSHLSWGSSPCALAAEGGQLEVLKWARAHGCPWDTRMCVLVSWNHHAETLAWVGAQPD
jgi:hypothetical protein